MSGRVASRHECARECLSLDDCRSFAYDYSDPIGTCHFYTSSCIRDGATTADIHTYDRSKTQCAHILKIAMHTSINPSVIHCLLHPL